MMPTRQVTLAMAALWLTSCVAATSTPSHVAPPTAQPSRLACGIKTIAYQYGLTLVLVDTDANEIKRLEDKDDYISFEEPFQWAPDGIHIAYQRYVPDSSGPAGLKVIDAKDGNIKQLTEADAFELDWSPDSSRIAFALFGKGIFWQVTEDDGLYLVNADGTHLTLLVKRFHNQEGYVTETRHPRWSPDGKQIAVSQVTFDSVQSRVLSSGILLISPDTSATHLIANGTAVLELNWSPDGTQLAFIALANPYSLNTGDIYTIGSGGSDLRKLTNHPGYYSSLSWSPNGKQLLYAYSEEELGQQVVFVIQPDGSQLRQLTRNPMIEPYPQWSPDGNCIAYKGSNLVVMNTDGSASTALTENYRPKWFQWRP